MEEFDELFDNELHLAVRVGDLDGCLNALKVGYNPNTIGLFEWSAVHEAAHNGETKILKLLLQHGGDPNKRDCLNGSTALHYAAIEGHPECLDLLLTKGGDVSIQNDNGLTFAQMTRHKKCKDVLTKHGIDIATSVWFEDASPTKSELRISEKNGRNLKTKNQDTKPLSLPTSTCQKQKNRSCLSEESYESGIGSRTTLSDTASVTSGTSSVLQSYEHSRRGQASSPCKSYSSFGSLTSIGSSIVSASDDGAGYITMSFQYNSKKSQLRLRISEIVLLCLLPYQKNKKESSLQLQICSKIYNPNEIQVNNDKVVLRAKGETFRLQPGGDNDIPNSEKEGSILTTWSNKDAKVRFQKAQLLDFSEVSKSLLSDYIIQVSVNARSRKNSMLTKSSAANVPVATLQLPLKQAAKNLMKETYELQVCHAPGITREQERLDQVLSELIVSSGKVKPASLSSEPHTIGMLDESFTMEEFERSVSDSDLKQVAVSPSTNSASSSYLNVGEEEESSFTLESVKSHSVPASPQVEVRMPTNKKESSIYCEEIAMDMPERSSLEYGDKATGKMLKKAKSKLHDVASGSTRSLHRLVMSRNQSMIENVDEEHSVGTRPEEFLMVPMRRKLHSDDTGTLNYEKESVMISQSREHMRTATKHADDQKQRHHRTLSNDSFTSIDESSFSPSRRRKQLTDNKKASSVARSRKICHEHNADMKHVNKPHTMLIYGDKDHDIESNATSPWYVDK